MQFNRRELIVLVVGLLIAVSLVLVSGTLSNATGEGGATITTEDESEGSMFDDDFEPSGQPFPLLNAAFTLLVAILFIPLFLLFVRDLATQKMAVAFVLAILALVITWLVLLAASVLLPEGLPNPLSVDQSGGSGIAEAGDDSGFGPSLPLIGGMAGIVIVLAVLVLWTFSTDDPEETDDEPEREAEPDPLESVGRAAGEAADALQESESTPANAVYEAWLKMTEALSVSNRASATPGEFADAAIEAGMAREDVADLTRLFEEVRYGDEPVSEERAARATDALRHIEESYGGDAP